MYYRLAEVSTISLVLLRVQSQYLPGDTFPISLACRGVFIIHRFESFTHIPTLISIKSWRNVSCSITWKKHYLLDKPKKYLQKCAKNPGLTDINCLEASYEAGEAGQNLRKVNFLKFCDAIKNFPKLEMKFKVFC